ncbi:Hypothetical predicted protein [Podarcis lilfordi]|uniref:Uncharacterized protein n=1 Tax=Podarcis lilfordi TaxID=74358 RepID=A0AA35KWE3_9SAUR|nr:Hypothetical predicted protein [Podarcis lilfordi]
MNFSLAVLKYEQNISLSCSCNRFKENSIRDILTIQIDEKLVVKIRNEDSTVIRDKSSVFSSHQVTLITIDNTINKSKQLLVNLKKQLAAFYCSEQEREESECVCMCVYVYVCKMYLQFLNELT